MVLEDSSAASFSTLLENMARYDFFSLLLPFLLTYVIFLFALRNVPLFQDSDDNPEKGIPEIVSLISAFFVAYFIQQNQWYQDFFTQYFGLITVGAVGILGLMVFLGMFGLDLDIFRKRVMIFALIAIVGAAFTSAGGFGPPRNVPLPDLGLTEVLAFLLDSGLIWLLVIAGVVLWLSADNDGDGGGVEIDWSGLFEPVNGGD